VELDPILNQTRFEIWKLEKFRNLEKPPSSSKNHIKKISSKFKKFMQPKSKGLLQI
jgi:hypothetical protein